MYLIMDKYLKNAARLTVVAGPALWARRLQ